MSYRSRSKYQKLFVWWNNVEHKIKGLIMLLFALLLLTQFALTNQTLNKLLNRVERFEGTAILDSEKIAEIGSIELQTINPESGAAVVYINGEKAADLVQNKVKLSVKNNDVLEISSIKCKRNLKVKVIYTSDNIMKPEQGKTYETDESLITLGRVKIK